MQNESSIPNQNSQPKLEIGTNVQGKFLVIERLNDEQSPMYLCKRLTPPHKGDTVALKLFGESRLGEDQETAMARFQHEIVAAFSVKHKNVAQIYETIRIGNMVGYICEHAEGGTLEAYLETHGQLTIPQTVSLLKQICAGTKAIHDAKIVHRGLAPASIIVTADGTIKIRDFGLAKLSGQKKLTVAGAIVGSVHYASPEYVLQGKCDHRLDIYSIGAMGFEMLCETTPHESTNLVAMFVERSSKPVPRPESFRPDCPPALADILVKALQSKPELRYQTTSEMLQDLLALPDYANVAQPLQTSTISSGMQMKMTMDLSDAVRSEVLQKAREREQPINGTTKFHDRSKVVGTSRLRMATAVRMARSARQLLRVPTVVFKILRMKRNSEE